MVLISSVVCAGSINKYYAKLVAKPSLSSVKVVIVMLRYIMTLTAYNNNNIDHIILAAGVDLIVFLYLLASVSSCFNKNMGVEAHLMQRIHVAPSSIMFKVKPVRSINN